LIKSLIVFKNSNVKLLSVFISNALFNIVSEPYEVLVTNAEFDAESDEALREAGVEKGKL
jgi:hypothetical protein